MSDQNFQPYPPQGGGQPDGQYSPYGQYSGSNYPEPQQPGNGLAVAALVCGIVGLLIFWFVLGPLAIIFGGIGWSRANRGAKHKALAIWGLALGVLAIVLYIVLIALAVSGGLLV